MEPLSESLGDLGQPVSVGLVSGYFSGLLVKKLGKAVAVSTGVVVVGMQTAAEMGYLTLHWDKIDADLNKFVKRSDQFTNLNGNILQLKQNIEHHLGPSGAAFTAGFLLGFRKG
jgi:uncharacterized membrane protein (Fun14 family)